MKKIKWLMLLAVLTATTAAFTNKIFDCYNMPQFFKIGNGIYQPAGTFGVDYFCYYSPVNTCTYYYDQWNDTYLPCRSGVYQSLPIPPGKVAERNQVQK